MYEYSCIHVGSTSSTALYLDLNSCARTSPESHVLVAIWEPTVSVRVSRVGSVRVRVRFRVKVRVGVSVAYMRFRFRVKVKVGVSTMPSVL